MQQYATFKNTIILFVCPSKNLRNHGFYSLLGLVIVSRENKNNASAKFWREKQRVLWYFWKWPFFRTLAHTKETLNESLPETEDPSSFPLNCWIKGSCKESTQQK